MASPHLLASAEFAAGTLAALTVLIALAAAFVTFLAAHDGRG